MLMTIYYVNIFNRKYVHHILLKYRTYEYRRKYGKVVFIRLDAMASQFRDNMKKAEVLYTFQTSFTRNDGLQRLA